MHFGAIYKSGKSGWTRKLSEIKKQLAWQMKLLDTDYTDMGFIHCTDEYRDPDDVMKPFAGGQPLEAKTSLFGPRTQAAAVFTATIAIPAQWAECGADQQGLRP